MNHIGDVNKLVSDTPRTDKAWKTTHSVYEFTVEMKRMERELNAANDRIRLLIAERDTARRQADQHYKLREEFRELLGTDDVEQGVAVVRGLKERIKRLEREIELFREHADYGDVCIVEVILKGEEIGRKENQNQQ